MQVKYIGNEKIRILNQILEKGDIIEITKEQKVLLNKDFEEVENKEKIKKNKGE